MAGEECNRDLQAAGHSYPRTCRRCGHGQCEKYPTDADTLPALAPALLGRNQLTLNAATMNRAVQEFFDRHAPGLGIDVESVNRASDGFVVITREVGTKP